MPSRKNNHAEEPKRANASALCSTDGNDPTMAEPSIQQHYLNGNGQFPPQPQHSKDSEILGFLRKNMGFGIAALIAGGWLLQPATKASVDDLSRKIDAFITTSEAHNNSVDQRLLAIEATGSDWRVWAAHVEERLGAPTIQVVTPPRKVVIRKKPVQPTANWFGR